MPDIAALMQAAFDAPANAPFLNPALLRWKYFDPNPAWPAVPRSYVLDQDGKLLSHGCSWPVEPGVACLIDWVSAKGSPGMGIMLARKIAQLSPVLLSIGGSEMTQKIMPKIGFTKTGELLTYARVLRPWRQFRTRPDNHGVKSLLRFARNIVWSLRPTALTSGWTAVESPGPEFLMRCPAARLKAYKLASAVGRTPWSASDPPVALGSVLVGPTPSSSGPYLLLSQVNGQSRIAELTIPTPEAYAAALDASLRDPEASELIALAHDGPTRRALIANGFEERMQRSVFVCGSPNTPLRLNMLADDLFYLNTPDHPYLT